MAKSRASGVGGAGRTGRGRETETVPGAPKGRGGVENETNPNVARGRGRVAQRERTSHGTTQANLRDSDVVKQTRPEFYVSALSALRRRNPQAGPQEIAATIERADARWQKAVAGQLRLRKKKKSTDRRTGNERAPLPYAAVRYDRALRETYGKDQRAMRRAEQRFQQSKQGQRAAKTEAYLQGLFRQLRAHVPTFGIGLEE